VRFLSITGSRKGGSKKKRKKGRRKQYGVPKFGSDGKLRSWVKKRLR